MLKFSSYHIFMQLIYISPCRSPLETPLSIGGVTSSPSKIEAAEKVGQWSYSGAWKSTPPAPSNLRGGVSYHCGYRKFPLRQQEVSSATTGSFLCDNRKFPLRIFFLKNNPWQSPLIGGVTSSPSKIRGGRGALTFFWKIIPDNPPWLEE